MEKENIASTMTICALLATTLLAAFAVPAAASPGEATTTDDGETTICVYISTNPPNAGVSQDCSGSGTVEVNGETIFPPPTA